MLVVLAPILAGGAKGFFEDPAYLIGIPLVALGAIGLLFVILPIGSKHSAGKQAARVRRGSDGEPADGGS
jgi:hypothetical protein